MKTEIYKSEFVIPDRVKLKLINNLDTKDHIETHIIKIIDEKKKYGQFKINVFASENFINNIIKGKNVNLKDLECVFLERIGKDGLGVLNKYNGEEKIIMFSEIITKFLHKSHLLDNNKELKFSNAKILYGSDTPVEFNEKKFRSHLLRDAKISENINNYSTLNMALLMMCRSYPLFEKIKDKR